MVSRQERTPTDRVPVHLAGVKGARPWGPGGNVPENAVTTTYSVHGRGVRAEGYAEAPYEEKYADRFVCEGIRKDGQPCKAKAEPGKLFCIPHDPEV